MDFNDLTSRLARLYSSIEMRFDENILEHVRMDVTPNTMLCTFGNYTEAEASNRIILIIQNLANLKDHLQNKLLQRGINKKVLESEINNSNFLKVILDIFNQDKHGTPLTKVNRTGLDPKIENIQSELEMSCPPGTFSGFSINLRTGIPKSYGTGNQKIIITADVLDKNNNILFSLDELIEGAVKDWEAVIQKYQLS